MKIGVIGNSHLAAFKLGWELVKNEHQNFDLTFFGSPTTSMRFLQIQDGALRPTTDLVKANLKWTSGGLDHIPGDLDGYICVGMGFSFIHLIALLESHRTYQDYDPSDENTHLISDGFLQAAMEGTLQNSISLQLIRQLRELSAAPIYCSPNPYAAVGILTSSKHGYFGFESTRDRAFRYYKQSLAEMLVPFSAVPFEQPQETITNDMFTKDEYSKGSVKLKAGMSSMHESDDHFHMNAEFGAQSLREILRHARGASSA